LLRGIEVQIAAKSISHFVKQSQKYQFLPLTVVGDSNMFTPEMHYLVFYLAHKERYKIRLREIEHQRLLRVAGLQESTTLKLYRQFLKWLGRQMVKWGTKLQSYATPDKGGQEVSLKIPMLPEA
jgi:hypothetical protein